MRFKISRTSNWSDSAPCDDAVAGEEDIWDVRTFKSAEEHDARLLSEKWLDRGTDHQTVYGPRGGVQGIKRRMGKRVAWFVEIEDLAALLAFQERHGDLIVTTGGGTLEVEIYDGYRE